MPSPWKRFRYRLEWLGLGALAWLAPRLPRPVILALAQGLGQAAYWVDYRGRSTALENLRVVYGSRLSEEQRKRVARRSYQIFARTMLDQFWIPRLTADNWPDYVSFDLPPGMDLESYRDRGAIWVTPHYGNFEWNSLVMGFRDFDFTIIAQDFKNPLLTGLFRRNREYSGHTVVPQEKSMLRLYKALRQGRHAAFLTDLNIKPGKAAIVIKCFGLKTCVTGLHAALARKTQAPVLAGISLPQADGTYRIKVFPELTLADGATDIEIAQACWDVFEEVIREDPEPWLWMYKHWRYRPADADADQERAGRGIEYPAYAGRSALFRRLDKAQEKAEAEAKAQAQANAATGTGAGRE